MIARLLFSLLIASGLCLPVATADAGAPASPRTVRLISATSSSLTVTLAAVKGARGYRVYASTTRSDVYVANIARAHRSAIARRPTITVRGLPYTTAPYYYRIETLSESGHSWDRVIRAAGLRTPAPTHVRVNRSAHAMYLTWGGATATGYQIETATDAAMTCHVHRWSIRGSTRVFTPYGLGRGPARFRIRVLNQQTPSAWSRVVRGTISARERTVTVLTYNVLEGNSTGVLESGQRIGSWPTRRPGVVALIRKAAPDIVAIQEAAAWIGTPQGYGGIRQIEDLVSALGGGYALAHTETPPTQHWYLRTGDYVLYRTAAYRTVGAGGHWPLGEGRFAAYQQLQNRQTGARLLVVSPHLTAGAGLAWDRRRAAETKTLIAEATGLAAGAHVPVVYAGDFNSDVNRNHVIDAPKAAMSAAGIVDAHDAAQQLVNDRYNSANLYLRTPPTMSQSIDYVFASPGVGVIARDVVLNLSGGHFVGVIPSDHNPLMATLTIAY